METLRLPRAGCPVTSIVATRQDGFITFAAIAWLHRSRQRLPDAATAGPPNPAAA
jgi:hypothetical protein